MTACWRTSRSAPDFASRYPDQLSGGERQRVAIARALVVSPELLVCDEVTSALDVSVQATIVELLRRLQGERHLALLFITHNLALVRSIAQTAVVSQGKLSRAGPVERILRAPREPLHDPAYGGRAEARPVTRWSLVRAKFQAAVEAGRRVNPENLYGLRPP